VKYERSSIDQSEFQFSTTEKKKILNGGNKLKLNNGRTTDVCRYRTFKKRNLERRKGVNMYAVHSNQKILG